MKLLDKYSICLLVATILTMSSCLKKPEPPQPMDPLSQGFSIHNMTSATNEMALVPLDIARRMELYLANDASVSVKAKILNATNIKETPVGSNIWTIEMMQQSVGRCTVSGTLLINLSKPDSIIIRIPTMEKYLTINNMRAELHIKNTDTYGVDRSVAGTYKLKYSVFTMNSLHDKAYPWTGAVTLIDNPANTTDITKITDLKYTLQDYTTVGEVPFGDGYFFGPGVKFHYHNTEPLSMARAKSNNTEYTKITNGGELITPYDANGELDAKLSFRVRYESATTNPFDTTNTKITVFFKDIVKIL